MTDDTVPHAQQVKIRLHDDLLDKLEEARNTNGRTMNGEITRRLEASFLQEDIRAIIAETVALTIAKLNG